MRCAARLGKGLAQNQQCQSLGVNAGGGASAASFFGSAIVNRGTHRGFMHVGHHASSRLLARTVGPSGVVLGSLRVQARSLTADAAEAEYTVEKSSLDELTRLTSEGEGGGVQVELKVEDIESAVKDVPPIKRLDDGTALAPLSDFDLHPDTMRGLSKRGITSLFPIQAETYKLVKAGHDVLARAKTGTGKTLAFTLPSVDKILSARDRGENKAGIGRRSPSMIVLTPTRELAIQVEKEISATTPTLKTMVMYGGTPYDTQVRALVTGVDIVVGTPGRVIDFLTNRGNTLDLRNVTHCVLDEADQMLKVGFQEAVEEIMEYLPGGVNSPSDNRPQTLLFSATSPPWIRMLSKKYLTNHKTVDLVGTDKQKLPDGVNHVAILVSRQEKARVLVDLVQVYRSQHSIIFTETKRDADRLGEDIRKHNVEGVGVLHGDVPQNRREDILNAFRRGDTKILVATDVAARGLDIDHVDLVVHYETPSDAETFIHRSGRTGRAGRKGTSILMIDPRYRHALSNISRQTGAKFDVRQPPDSLEILESTFGRHVQLFESVDERIIDKFFKKKALEMVAEGDPIDFLARALAVSTGYTKMPKSRGLITHLSNYQTVEIAKPDGNQLSKYELLSLVKPLEHGRVFQHPDVNISLRRSVAKTSMVADVQEFNIPRIMKSLDGVLVVREIASRDELPDLEPDPRDNAKNINGGSGDAWGSMSQGARRGRGGYSSRRGGSSYGDRGSYGGRGAYGGRGSYGSRGESGYRGGGGGGGGADRPYVSKNRRGYASEGGSRNGGGGGRSGWSEGGGDRARKSGAREWGESNR